MYNLFESQQAVAERLTSSSEKFNFLCSVLRSLFQVAAVTALETIREQTPDAVDNAALGAFAKRFNQPTDGLPVEILEVATPVIRSYVSRTYHSGWFERDPNYGDIKQAGERTLRRAANQLANKPLLIETLVKYLARNPIGIDQAIEQVFRKTNDQLLEFLYEDAWLRINELQQDVFLVLVAAMPTQPTLELDLDFLGFLRVWVR